MRSESPLQISSLKVTRTLRRFAILAVAAAICLPIAAQSYKVTNLVSDGSVPAATTDPNFLNPWAMSASGTWWISTANTGFNYVVPSTTNTIAFKVVVPSASGNPANAGLPAGSITTAGATGMVLSNGTKASFLFSTLDGTISGWNGKLGTNGAIALVAINNSAAGASYPGLATINNASGSFLLAANFGTGNAIEVYDSAFKPAKLAGTFTDPNLPANYAPFGIHVIGSQVYVSYALRTAAAPFRTVDARGNGAVSIFDVNGNFVARAVTGGNLNSPWGVAIAPADFGIYSNALLVGNFGDGLINAFDPKTFVYLGQLMDTTGKSLQYASLWELLPGHTAVQGATSFSGGDASTVYFTAGLVNEAHGLLGAIAKDTTTGTPNFNFTSSTPSATVPAGNAASFTLNLVPVNGFNGTVNLACSNLPTSATCSFTPTSYSLTPSTIASGTVTIVTTSKTAAIRYIDKFGIVSAVLFPFASIMAFRRRSANMRLTQSVRLLGLVLVFACIWGFITGCSDSSSPGPTPTPPGVSNVVITATAGAATQQTTVALTVQ